jgi:hypothetical protein
MSHLVRDALGLAIALAAALPASACLNDRQLIVAENEFRSSYLSKKADKPGLLARVPVGGWAALGLGTALLGATMVVSRRPRQ